MRCPQCKTDYPADVTVCGKDGAPLLEPVAEVLQRGPIALTQAAKIVDRVAELLSGIHAAGKIHGALSSDTVFFRHVGASLTVAISELGERRMQSPRFVPPERRKKEREDLRGDLYALGVLLDAMLKSDPPQLQDIPEDMEKLIAELRSESPDARPASADAVRARIENMDLDSTIMGVRLAQVRDLVKEVERETPPDPISMDAPTIETVDPYADTFIRKRSDILLIDRDTTDESPTVSPVQFKPKSPSKAQDAAASEARLPSSALRAQSGPKVLEDAAAAEAPALIAPKRTPSLLERQRQRPDAITEAAPPREAAARPPLPFPLLFAATVLLAGAIAAAVAYFLR